MKRGIFEDFLVNLKVCEHPMKSRVCLRIVCQKRSGMTGKIPETCLVCKLEASAKYLQIEKHGLSTQPKQALHLNPRPSTGLARFPKFHLTALFFVKISMCSYEKAG